MYFLSDVSDNIEFARGRDKTKRKHKGSMLLHGIGVGVGGALGETVLNKKLGLEGTNFKDTVWDRKGKFWNHNKK